MNIYKKSILIIGVITCIGLGGFLIWNQLQTKPETEKVSKIEKQSIDELLEQSVDTETITTNFADEGFIKIKLKIIANSSKNAEEIKKLPFLVESTVIKYYNGITSKEASGPKAFTLMENNLKNKLNKALGADYVTQVYIVEQIIQ